MASLEKSIHKTIEDNINIFAQNIAKKFDLNVDEVLELWYDDSDKKTSTKDKAKSKDRKCNRLIDDKSPENNSISDSDLAKSTNAELKALCKAKGLKTTGKKSDLLDRILGKDVSTKDKSSKKSSKKSEKTPTVQKTIQSSLTTIQLRRNKFGNYEHPDTKLIFSKVDRTVIGKQNSDGKILDLASEDIETCNKYKFKYHLPENLNSKDGGKVRIAEIDDDDSELEEDSYESDDNDSGGGGDDDLSDFYESD